MVLNKFADIVSAVANSLSVSKPSAGSFSSSRLPPTGASNFAIPGKKSNLLRLSSSLQDFSLYSRLDPEEGDINPGNSRILPQTRPPHVLLRENGGTSFSKEKSPPRKKWVRLISVLLCLLFFAFLLYTVQFFYSNWSQGSYKFYVVLDCGSTGTRVYVYQASINHKKDGSLPISVTSLPELQKKSTLKSGRAYNRMETEPGFDKLVHNASGLKKAIKPLIRWAEKQIPKKLHKNTSLFLYATAGVRRLPSSDSEWLLNHAWSILKTSSFLCQRDWVKIISGMEEAYYGWIALNHHTGVLGSIPRKATFGALDLGGSSLQVTFESKEQMRNDTSLQLSIGPVNHHLSAYSLSGYGLNDAFDKSVAHLFKKLPGISGNIEIKHPCLQSGYKEQYICSKCASIYQDIGSPLVGGKKLGKIGKPGKPGIQVQLIGAPKWTECSALAKVAVNLSEWSDISSTGIDCELQPCALAGDLPRPHGQFYAMSGFFVVYRFLNLTSDATFDDVLEKGQEYCEKTWDIAKNSVPPQPFIEQYCFRAPYIVRLLREGLYITDKQVTVGSGSITWTLGVALMESGKTFSTTLGPHRYEILQMKINPVVLLIVVLISLFFLVCALSCVGHWMPRFLRRSYLPLFRHNNASNSSVLNIPSPFLFQRWSPISKGDGKVKLPLSPTVADAQQRTYGLGHGFGGSSIQLVDSSLYPSTSSVSHSYSSGSLGQIQFDNNGMGTVWSPHRSQMHLQSRRSQSREDLHSSLAEAAHLVKL